MYSCTPRMFIASAITVTLLVTSSAKLPVMAQSGLPAQIDTYIAAAMIEQHIPGLALAVIRDDQVIVAKGYGLADVENNQPVTSRTRFESASLGKQFTAVAILLLVQDSKLKLDDPLSTYIDGVPSAWKGVTLQGMLTHTSGLPYELSRAATDEKQACRSLTTTEFLQRAFSTPLEYEPGSRYVYSDLGYQLLGLVVERTAGQSRAAFLKERVFTPAGMTDAQVLSAEAASSSTAVGYRFAENRLQPQACIDQLFADDGAGGLLLSLEDWMNWDAVLSSGQIIPTTLLRQAWTPVTLNDGTTYPYGFGWDVQRFNDKSLVEHGGVSNGFSAWVARYAPDNVTVIVLTNLRLARTWEVAHDLAALVEPSLQIPATTDSTVINDPEPQVTARVKAVLDAIRRGTLTLDDLTAELQPLLADILSLGPDLDALGEPTKLTLLDRNDSGEIRTYRYRVQFGQVSGIVTIAFDSSDRIANLEVAN